jgi:predicted RNA binding protein YcfA (HicA-like mRNA interferase family)
MPLSYLTAMRKQKLLDRLTNNPKDARFDDVRTLLLYEGFKLERITGSHYVFSTPDITLAIPVHANRVKSVYDKRVIKLIEQAKGKAK